MYKRQVYGDPKRLFSFALGEEDLRQLGRVCERFLTTQVDRGFRTLEFYKDLTFSARPVLSVGRTEHDRLEDQKK